MYNQFILEGKFLRDKKFYIFQKGKTDSKSSIAQANIATSSVVNRDNGIYYNRGQWFNIVFRGEFAEITHDLLIDNGLYVFEGELACYTKPFKFFNDNRVIAGTVLLCYKVYASKRKTQTTEFKLANGVRVYKPDRIPRKKTVPTFDPLKDKDLELVCKKPHIATEKEKAELINKKLTSAAVHIVEPPNSTQAQPQVNEWQQSYRTNYDPEDF